MNIDWNKWIIEHLPFSLRRVRVFTLVTVLISPTRRLYQEFVTWSVKTRIKSAGSPQVCMLKRTVKDELGLDVLIEVGNGKPIDFIIRTSFDNVDIERQLFALLDRYKLAGKSYGYENAEIILTGIWSSFVCERAEAWTEWTAHICEKAGNVAEWTGFICEKAGKRENLITVEIIGVGQQLIVTASLPAWNVPVKYSVYKDSQLGGVIDRGTIYYQSTIENERKVFDLDIGTGYIDEERSISLGIDEDELYIYQLKVK